MSDKVVVLVFPNAGKAKEFLENMQGTGGDVKAHMLNEYSGQSALWRAINTFMFNTANFRVRDGRKWYSANDIRAILERHKVK